MIYHKTPRKMSTTFFRPSSMAMFFSRSHRPEPRKYSAPNREHPFDTTIHQVQGARLIHTIPNQPFPHDRFRSEPMLVGFPVCLQVFREHWICFRGASHNGRQSRRPLSGRLRVSLRVAAWRRTIQVAASSVRLQSVWHHCDEYGVADRPDELRLGKRLLCERKCRPHLVHCFHHLRLELPATKPLDIDSGTDPH